MIYWLTADSAQREGADDKKKTVRKQTAQMGGEGEQIEQEKETQKTPSRTEEQHAEGDRKEHGKKLPHAVPAKEKEAENKSPQEKPRRPRRRRSARRRLKNGARRIE